MTNFVERVKSHAYLPLDEVIVVGSGVLDVLGLREANDIDLLASVAAFERIKLEPSLSSKFEPGEENASEANFLEGGEIEIWLDWREVDGQLWDYDYLNQSAFCVDGVKFAAPEKVLQWKRAMGRSKDRRDIKLLEEYLRERD